MFEASCHCGLCVLAVEGLPETVTDCNCSICFKYGVLWAYYTVGAVDRSRLGPTDRYVWGDRKIAFLRCQGCGCLVCWWPVDEDGLFRCGINARLFPLAVASALRVRHLDGAGTEEYID